MNVCLHALCIVWCMFYSCRFQKLSRACVCIVYHAPNLNKAFVLYCIDLQALCLAWFLNLEIYSEWTTRHWIAYIHIEKLRKASNGIHTSADTIPCFFPLHPIISWSYRQDLWTENKNSSSDECTGVYCKVREWSFPQFIHNLHGH